MNMTRKHWIAGALIWPLVAGCVRSAGSTEPVATRPSGDQGARVVKSEEEWKKQLSAEQYEITRCGGTEPAFTGKYWNHKEAGTYRCVGCGQDLFASDTKFDSGTGWPSFWAPKSTQNVRAKSDHSFGMARTEVLCSRCDAHLGHIFDDGPQPTGQRYCINSAALNFEPAGSAAAGDTETAYFAGGCFWGIEDHFQKVPGVIDAVSGYMGGSMPDPSYKAVCTGRTGHAETVRVTFDPQKVTYPELLTWFFKLHDPTQLNRQGPDVGTQYRSAIFSVNETQDAAARKAVADASKSERFAGRKIVTAVEKADDFHEAEEYHQNYHAKHGGSCPLPE